jgi:hypothetical protein
MSIPLVDLEAPYATIKAVARIRVFAWNQPVPMVGGASKEAVEYLS